MCRNKPYCFEVFSLNEPLQADEVHWYCVAAELKTLYSLLVYVIIKTDETLGGKKMFIYEPSGKAREYSELAVNLYTGCDHACSYCYVPAIRRKKREDCTEVTVRKDVLKGIEKELQKKDFTEKTVLFCFMTDPYCAGSNDTTGKAAEMILHHGGRISILTKGGKRSERDFDLFESFPGRVDYGITLTCLDQRWKEFEPGAASPDERIEVMNEAKKRGLKTWVSLEPVVDPEEAKNIIKKIHKNVDLFKIGIWNYDKRAAKIDFKRFGYEVKQLLDDLGCAYYLKKDLITKMN